ncbi:MAG: M3 family oligoendopeptidase [Chloroflexota bacterium]|nr:MAG: M3 family oligoendopeptidase [Chloroflexota bacterium]
MTGNRYKQGPWSLVDLFEAFDAPEVELALERVEALLTEIEVSRSVLAPDSANVLDTEAFLELLEKHEALDKEISALFAFASLRFAADTQDQTAHAALARFRQMAAEAHNRVLFFELWWKGLDEEQAEPLLAISGDYRYWLEALRLQRPYTLSEPEERVVNLKNVNGPAALMTLLSTITDRYTFNLKIDGEIQELTRDELTVHYRNPDPGLRAAAYQELFRVYEQDKPVLGQIYQSRVRDWQTENLQLRGFASPIAVRNLANDMPDEVVDLLLEVSRQNASVFQRYFRLKARWLGMEQLRRYDVYAPIIKTEKRLAYADAVDLVLSSYRRFDPRVADLAERVFAENHIDTEVRKGKRGGAFCATVSPDHTPWIMQSYHGRPSDAATMAHELGHAVHSMLAEHHSALTQQSSLPLAETASTFGEMIVIDRLLAEDPNPETQRDLLFRQMDDNYATIMRQAYFAIFERDAHELVKNGATIDELSDLYAGNLAEQFGNSMSISDDFSLEWLVIPHIYRVPFYVYAYAFGQLLVLSLYQQYLEEGDAFKPRYFDILAAGGSDAPARILDKAGIDIRSAEFWQGGYDVLTSALERLEALDVVVAA